MKEELENQLAKVLEQALSIAEKSGEFVMEQAPMILKEFYVWHTIDHILTILLGIAFILTGRYLPYTWLRKEDEGGDARFFKKFGEEAAGAAWTVFIVFGLLGVCMTIVNTFMLVKILVSPKLYLIEYFL